jgi:hypothetical protein
MFQVETRINFGEELPASHSEGGWKHGDINVPWSVATKSVVDCGTWLPGRVIYVWFFHFARSVSMLSTGEGIWWGSMCTRKPIRSVTASYVGIENLYLIVLPLRCEVVVGCAHAYRRERELQVAVLYAQNC